MADKTTPEVAATESSVADVQKKMDVITDQGYEGTVPDETPLENYTVAGVTAGKPTPETTPPFNG